MWYSRQELHSNYALFFLAARGVANNAIGKVSDHYLTMGRQDPRALAANNEIGDASHDLPMG